MTGNTDSKQQELGIFERFAKATGLEIEGSITQPERPDILCTVPGIGVVGFELTALDRSDEHMRISLMSRTQEFWSQGLASCTPAQRDHLHAAHCNVQVALTYLEPSDTRTRRSSIAEVIQRLASKDADFEGQLYTRFDQIISADLPAAEERAWAQFREFPPGSTRTLVSLIDPPPTGIQRAEVRRYASLSEGPIAFGASPGFWVPPNLEQIDKKLTYKRYSEIGHRLELLAYVRWGGPGQAELDGRDLKAYTADRSHGTPFSRIWLYEAGSDEVLAQYAE